MKSIIKLSLSMLLAISNIYSSELRVSKEPDRLEIDMQLVFKLQAQSRIEELKK